MRGLNWGVVLVLVLAWGGAGYLAGVRHRNNAWLAKQALQERAAREALEKEVARSQAAAAQAAAQQAALQANYTTLQGKFNALLRRGPLVVLRDDRPGGTDSIRPAVRGTVDRPDSARSVATGLDPGDSDLSRIDLNFGAVWMWNSALAGADTPAGACSAADTASPACAAGSGIGLEAAWANHTTNAQSCAADRLRFQQLIDYLQAWPAPKHD